MKYGTSFVYLRDAKRFPVACLAIHTEENSPTASFGVATHNPHDLFKRSKARGISMGRMLKKPVVVDLPEPNVPHSVVIGAVLNTLQQGSLPPRLREAVSLAVAGR